MSFRGGQEARLLIAGSPVAFTNEDTITTDDRIYTIEDADKQVFDYNSPITVYVDGQPANEDFLIDYTRGKIIFAVADLRIVTISGKYVTTVQAATANKFNLNMKADIYDVTCFGDTFKRSKAGMKYAEGTVSMIEVGDSFYTDALTRGDAILLEFRNSPTDPKPKRIWAYMDSLALTASVTEVQNKEVSFKSTGIF